jgi:hypothetical protein
VTQSAFESQNLSVALEYVSSMSGFQTRQYLPRIAVPAGFYTFEIIAVAGTNPMVVFINESFTFYQADF